MYVQILNFSSCSKCTHVQVLKLKLKRYLRANPYAMNRKEARSHLLTDTPWKASFLHSSNMHGFKTQQLNSNICQSHFRQAIYTLSIAANHTLDKLIQPIYTLSQAMLNEAAVDGL